MYVSNARFEVVSPSGVFMSAHAGSESAHADALQFSAEDDGDLYLVLDTYRTEEQGRVILTSDDEVGSEPNDPCEG